MVENLEAHIFYSLPLYHNLLFLIILVKSKAFILQFSEFGRIILTSFNQSSAYHYLDLLDKYT